MEITTLDQAVELLNTANNAIGEVKKLQSEIDKLTDQLSEYYEGVKSGKKTYSKIMEQEENDLRHCKIPNARRRLTKYIHSL